MNDNSTNEPRIYLCDACYRALGIGLEDEYIMRYACIVWSDDEEECEECKKRCKLT